MQFRLEKSSELKLLLKQYPVWAEYYSPNDIDSLVKDGFDREEIEESLKSVDYSNDYVFPVNHHEKESPYEFTFYDSEIILPNSEKMDGYIFYIKGSGVNSISIFYDGEEYVLNLSEPEVTEEDETELKMKLNIDSIYPLELVCDSNLKIDQKINPYK